MSSPIVHEAAQMRNDEIDLGIFRSEEIHDLCFAGNVDEEWQPEGLGCLANFARRRGVERVNLNAAKIPVCHGMLNHAKNAPGVSLRMHEGKTDQTVRRARHEASNLSIALRVVAAKQ